MGEAQDRGPGPLLQFNQLNPPPFFAPDVGMVAAVEQMDASAMLVYNRHKKVAKLLASKPK